VPLRRHHPSNLSKRPVVYISSCSEAFSNQNTVVVIWLESPSNMHGTEKCFYNKTADVLRKCLY
ncbi:hypothetical protein NDU88_004471, partial [Pleurodeles waltl]